jgi:putative membrane protein insertion efficiency factor
MTHTQAAATPPAATASPAPASRRAVLLAIRGYQRLVSPLLGPTCRFHPSCSSYAASCVERFGVGRGLWLGARRIARCHPFHPGGFDPPPEAPEPAAGSLVHGQP